MTLRHKNTALRHNNQDLRHNDVSLRHNDLDLRHNESFPSILLDATAWYRGDKLITLNGSTVSAWGDLTGNGNTATQGTEANQFAFVGSAINGKAALESDGNDSIALSSPSYGNTALSVFFVAHAITDGSTQTFFNQPHTGDNTSWTCRLDGNNRLNFITKLSGTTSASIYSTATPTSDIVVVIRYEGSSASGSRVRMSINGASETLSNANASFNALDGRDLSIGVNTIFPLISGVQIAEGWVSDSAITDAEFESIEQYAAARYGITLA